MADRPSSDAVPLASIERCAGLLPGDAELLADLGAAYDSAGRAEEAEAAYRRALERDPDYADVHTQLARLLLRRHAAAEARTHAERALHLQPNRRAVVELLEEASRTAERDRR